MKISNIAIVVPTIRENSIVRFIFEWGKIFQKYETNLIVIEDNPSKTFNINLKEKFKIFHYSWEDIKKILEKTAG